MPQSPVQKRQSRCKAKVMKSLLDCYRIVFVAPWPCHFHCPEAKLYVRVEVNSLDENMRQRLQQFKDKACRDGEKIQVFLFKKYSHKPEVMDIH